MSDAADARSLLRAEGPHVALDRLKREVRTAPRDARLRTFLFQLFCITGEWDRALTQLTVAAELDPLALPMAEAYRAAIRAELLRERVFLGKNTPTIFGKPDSWISLLVEANRLLASGEGGHAAKLRDAAFEEAPATAGSANEEAFEWIADADPRLGPVLEAFVDGKYYWVPFYRLSQVKIDPPEDLRDQVWMPAQFTWANGGETVGFIPTRYPGSAQSEDGGIALARKTEWLEQGDWFLGLGQRMLTTDTGDIALMDLRQLTVEAPEGTAEPELLVS